MARPPKFDYDGDDFYTEILALAMQGLNDAEIAFALEEKFGVSLSPEAFCSMKNGKYDKWNDKENERRSARLVKVLARGRYKVLGIVRGRYLKAALGGIKTKSKSVTKRKMVVDGQATEDEIVQTTENEVELPPNMQALATWLYHHDPEWRKVERKLDEDSTDIPTDIEKGVEISRWIDKEVGKE